MLKFIVRRLITMIPMTLVISMVCFIVIQLPPGDYLTTLITQLEAQGILVDETVLETYRIRYGLGEPGYVQYYRWVSGILTRGDFGVSWDKRVPVSHLIWQRLGLTLVVTTSSFLFTWIVAIPIGIYSAVRQHTAFDYIFTFIGFIGLATPNFVLALAMMYFVQANLEFPVTGLFSGEYVMAPWSWEKVMNMLPRLVIPMIVIGTAGTAGLIRVMRNNLLDELNKPYVVTAKARGITGLRMLLKYPVRIAVNPLLSTVGWMIPLLLSGEAIVSIVMNLPTTGPLLLDALFAQDMYLAGALLLLLALATMVGTLISDILLVVADPRIKYE